MPCGSEWFNWQCYSLLTLCKASVISFQKLEQEVPGGDWTWRVQWFKQHGKWPWKYGRIGSHQCRNSHAKHRGRRAWKHKWSISFTVRNNMYSTFNFFQKTEISKFIVAHCRFPLARPLHEKNTFLVDCMLPWSDLLEKNHLGFLWHTIAKQLQIANKAVNGAKNQRGGTRIFLQIPVGIFGQFENEKCFVELFFWHCLGPPKNQRI